MIDLSVSIGNLKLKNPVLTASGTFGYGEEYSPYFDLSRLGGLITKTITLKPRAGNAFPRIAETAAGMLNSIGLANVGVEAFIKDKLPYLRRLDTAIVVNVAGFTVDEYGEVVRRLDDAEGIDAYEINVSCPNVKEGGVIFGSNPMITAQITEIIKKITSRHVMIKLTPNVTRIEEMAIAVEKAGADSVSLINTMIGMAVDVDTRRPRIASVKAGLSGPAIKPIAIAKVFDVAQHTDLPIIGLGGIMNYRDALEFLITGASGIQVGTANYMEPDICSRIIDDLKHYCEKNKIPQLRQIIGSLNI
ncbi:MAG: dihydroorotate dehydrogenase [candidate division KSB1 bacterium]|nr:dihydroorotate dehydrogenase [candidate division KSB1 bacterium]